MELKEIKNSGKLELYVLGELTPEENAEIEQSISNNPELKKEVFEIEKAFEAYAMLNARDVDRTGRGMLATTISYVERLTNGELPVIAPPLSAKSKIIDFKKWLDRDDLQEPESYDSMSGHIISATPERKSIIIWLKQGAPPEVHTHEIEKFLILEGTCDITIGDKVYSLKSGDFLEIPLFVSHHIVVTSPNRCKIILERSAA